MPGSLLPSIWKYNLTSPPFLDFLPPLTVSGDEMMNCHIKLKVQTPEGQALLERSLLVLVRSAYPTTRTQQQQLHNLSMTEAQVISRPNDPSTVVVTTAPSIDRPDLILPPEITDQVIDNLRGDQKALRQCALTCRAWRLRSQLCLNHTVRISSRVKLKAFAAHLRDPRCLPYLHDLTFSPVGPLEKMQLMGSQGRTLTMVDQFVHLVPLILPQVLESVKVVTIDYIAWNQFPPHPNFRFLPTQFPHVVSLTVIPPVLSTHPRMRARLRELYINTVPECLETLRDLRLRSEYHGTNNAIMRKLSQAVGPSLESLSLTNVWGIELFTTCTRLHFLSLSPFRTIPLGTLVDRLSSVVSREFRELYISIDTGVSEPEKMLLQWHRLDDVFMQEQFRMLTVVKLRWQVDLEVKRAVLAKKLLKQFPKLRSRGILEVGTYDCTGTPILEASAGPITTLDDPPESDYDSEEEDLEVSSETSAEDLDGSSETSTEERVLVDSVWLNFRSD
ncbi:hypothetical protein B0H21DRAFT_713435 [Amylocystis lapponica]|nr:hypothetical protein B0H21DRAFT_713435 [Amylocystis lapponica]